MKHCFKCGERKPLHEFYEHPMMADGHLGKCKDCTKRDAQLHYAANREQYSQYEQQRSQEPERKRQQGLHQAAMRRRYPERYKARAFVNNAIRDGKLMRQPCRLCGNPKSQAHHSDYSQPFLIDWLCFKCHREHEHGQTVTVAA